MEDLATYNERRTNKETTVQVSRPSQMHIEEMHWVPNRADHLEGMEDEEQHEDSEEQRDMQTYYTMRARETGTLSYA